MNGNAQLLNGDENDVSVSHVFLIVGRGKPMNHHCLLVRSIGSSLSKRRRNCGISHLGKTPGCTSGMCLAFQKDAAVYIYMYTCYLLVTSMAKLLKVPSFEISVHACVCVCVCVSVFELHQILWLAYSRYTDVYMIHQWMKIELVTPSV